MLDDITKSYIMLDIKCLATDDDIIKNYGITSGTLKAIKNEYEKIKELLLVDAKSISEIALSIKTTEEYIENVRHIIETDADQLLDEVEQERRERQDAENAPPPQEEPPPPQTEEPIEPQEHADENIPAENNGAEKKRGRPKTKNGDGKEVPTKNIDSRLKKTAEAETATTLVNDAGDIGKSLSINRQEIGKYVMEQMGTVAMQFGYKDFKQFLDKIFNFYIENHGKIEDLNAQIEYLNDINQQMQDTIDQEIFKLTIAKSLDRVTIAALIGGGNINLETLFAYKRLLESSGNGINQNNGGIAYGI